MRNRPPALRASFGVAGKLVVDLFAGGGGASTGIEDIAINHDAAAIGVVAARSA